MVEESVDRRTSNGWYIFPRLVFIEKRDPLLTRTCASMSFSQLSILKGLETL
jgi:hypothetical protein